MPDDSGRIQSVFAIADSSFNAADLAEHRLLYVDPEWQVDRALAWMDERNIDVAPLRDRTPSRFVLRDDLRSRSRTGLSSESARVVDISHLVTGDVGLGDALTLLEDRSFLFTIEGGAITGIITPSDVQRTPVSMVVLGFVLASEAGMNHLIAREYGTDDRWLAKLSRKRAGDLEERYSQRLRRNAERERLDLLMLEDRLTILKKTPSLRKAVGYSSGEGFKRWSETLRRIRDDLAHGGSMLDHEPDPIAALRCVREVRDFAERVWQVAQRASEPPSPSRPD